MKKNADFLTLLLIVQFFFADSNNNNISQSSHVKVLVVASTVPDAEDLAAAAKDEDAERFRTHARRR